MRITRTWPKLPTKELLNELHTVLHERILSKARGQRKSLTSFQLTDAKAAEINIQKRMASQAGQSTIRQQSELPVAQIGTSSTSTNGVKQIQARAGASSSTSRDQAAETNTPEPSHEPNPEGHRRFSSARSLSPKPLEGLLDPDTSADISTVSVELPRANTRAVEEPFDESSMLQDRSYKNTLHQTCQDDMLGTALAVHRFPVANGRIQGQILLFRYQICSRL
ncbi:hypothetical protein IFR05_013702 [Cadophora sp. M221]|nr:hypothetical protein IFR05_013702 [Cadophora sp. M221]